MSTKPHEENTKKYKTGLTRLASGLTRLIADPVYLEKKLGILLPVHPAERLRGSSCGFVEENFFLKSQTAEKTNDE
ncbi:MAG: hypothetical protein ACKVZH_03815 [Blastocatellia bacterium]